MKREGETDEMSFPAEASRDDGHFLLLVIVVPLGSISLLVLILAKNEEQILALERETDSFSWTGN